MSDSVTLRRCKITSSAISRTNYEANKGASGARAYLEGLTYTNAHVVSNAPELEQDSHDSTNAGSGDYAETAVTGHKSGKDEIEFQFNQYDRPLVLTRGSIYGLIVFLDIAGDGLPGTTPVAGSEKVMFIGFIVIRKVGLPLPQRGAITIKVEAPATGWHKSDVMGG